MAKRKFSYYLILYFSLISLVVLMSLFWAFANYESLLNAYQQSIENTHESKIELSRVYIDFLYTDSLGAADAAVNPSHAELLTEPYYMSGEAFLLRKNGAFYPYTGDLVPILRNLKEIKSSVSADLSSKTLDIVKYSFIASILLVFGLVIILFFRLNRKLNRNMDGLVGNLNSQSELHEFAIEEFDHIDKEIRRFQTKALQTERQTVVSDVLSNWQIEVKKIIHDLKNPLQRIKLMLSDVDAEKSAMALDAVDEIQRNLKEIRSTELTQDINPSEIDVHGFFDRIRSLFYEIEIDLVVTAAQPLVFDEYALQRVCSNLIQNAIEAGASKLTFFISNENGKSVIEIANDGEKINDPSKLFVPFSTTKKEGSGLGLVIILQFVHLHHGHIFLKHSTDQETMFRIELP